MGRILVIDDHDSLRHGLVRSLANRGHEIEDAANGTLAIELLQQRQFDVVLTDLRMGGADGMDVLRTTRSIQPSAAVILMTAFGSIHTAVEAMKIGAFDFVQKPFEIEEMELKIEKAIELRHLKSQVEYLRTEQKETYDFDRIVGASGALQQVLGIVKKVARSNSTILIRGETGTGKELIAGAIHHNSNRANRAFVKVNCAALQENLLESELFGHEKGAFTSADKQRIGRFEQADGGTLFLDEVGDMSASTQAKILRVLQEHEFERLGGTRTLRVDVRIIAATNRNLSTMVQEGRFREDLFYRLNVVSVEIPPLRERKEDIPALAQFFAERFARDLHKEFRGFSASALGRLTLYSWPGNVLELKHVIERAMSLSNSGRLTIAHVRLRDSSQRPTSTAHAMRHTPAHLQRLSSYSAVAHQALGKSSFDPHGSPSRRSATASGRVHGRSVHAEPAAAPGQRPRILLVQPRGPATDRLVRFLCRHGSEVRACPSASTLPGDIGHFRPNVVALDLALPELRSTRLADLRRFGVPLVALTPARGSATILKAASAGFVDYLVQPISAPAVLARLSIAANETSDFLVPPNTPGPVIAPSDWGPWVWLGRALAPTVSGASHDALNHLAAARGALELLEKSEMLPTNADWSSAFDSALMEVNRCYALITDLNALSRTFSSSIDRPFWIYSYAMPAAITDMCRLPPHASLTIDTTSVNVGFRIPRVLLWHLLLPAINNAVEALYGRTGTVAIRMATDVVGQTLSICIADDGPGWGGIRERLWESLRTDSRMSTKGSRRGAGLQNLNRLVLALGGRLLLSTSDFGGASVDIALPWRIR